MKGYEEASLGESWGKSIPGREGSTCKGPEAGRLGVLEEEQRASVAGKEGGRDDGQTQFGGTCRNYARPCGM